MISMNSPHRFRASGVTQLAVDAAMHDHIMWINSLERKTYLEREAAREQRRQEIATINRVVVEQLSK